MFSRLRLPGGAWTQQVRAWVFLFVFGALVSMTLSACGGDGSDVDRGPTTISTTVSLNGLYWDADASKLYLTDDVANAVRVGRQ